MVRPNEFKYVIIVRTCFRIRMCVLVWPRANSFQVVVRHSRKGNYFGFEWARFVDFLQLRFAYLVVCHNSKDDYFCFRMCALFWPRACTWRLENYNLCTLSTLNRYILFVLKPRQLNHKEPERCESCIIFRCYFNTCSLVLMSRFGRDLNQIEDGLPCRSCLARSELDTTV